MKKFIALGANKCKLKKGILPISLTLGDNSLRDMCDEVKINKDDIIVGYSLGASIALIVAEKTPPKELHLYSPSLIFTETIGLLDKENLEYFGEKRHKEVKTIPKVSCPVTIYVGSLEDKVMIKSASIIADHIPHSKLVVINGADHRSVVERYLQ